MTSPTIDRRDRVLFLLLALWALALSVGYLPGALTAIGQIDARWLRVAVEVAIAFIAACAYGRRARP